jgi:S1-C subfamily serine protease
MSNTRIFLLTIFAAVIGGLIVFSGMTYAGFQRASADQSQNPSSDVRTTGTDADSNPQGSFASASDSILPPSGDREEQIVQKIYEDVSPSVVHITTVSYAYNFWRSSLEPQKGTGSGCIVDSKGYILTNFHVVSNALTNKAELFVTFANGESEEAEIVGYDQISDLAVIKLKNDLGSALPVAPLGDSDKLKVGGRAIAIGNPFGLSGTCTVGFISALNRTVNVGTEQLEGMIQTDATINPGNSGGPLINSSGQVIGINSVIFSQSGGSEGIGFAIPINAARQILGDLIQYGKVRRPYLGAETFPVLSTLATYFKLPVTEGLLIQSVEPGSPAAKAGLKGGTQAVEFRHYRIFIDGDIIVSLNGEKVTNPMEFERLIQKMKIGDSVKLEVYRGNKKIEMQIVLEMRK